MKVHSQTGGVEYFISRDEGTLTDKRSRILHYEDSSKSTTHWTYPLTTPTGHTHWPHHMLYLHLLNNIIIYIKLHFDVYDLVMRFS